MKPTLSRLISQIFFLWFFLWFCITSTIGINFWQLRGWSVNWFLELDPLVGFAAFLTTGVIYKGLIWGVATLILTLIFGRFFCGWVCPFGTLHQFAGFLGKLGRSKKELLNINSYKNNGLSFKYNARSFKYAVLTFFIASNIITSPLLPINLVQITPVLLTGLLDPIPFVYRFVNLTLLPFADSAFLHLSANPRYYDGAWVIGAFGITALLLNLWIPRFYCRYICPLGALFGVIAGMSFFQIGKKKSPCNNCMKCQFDCEGACDPMGKIRLSECVLCMNCFDKCDFLTYQAASSQSSLKEKNLQDGQYAFPEISRRAFAASIISGITILPMLHLSSKTGTNWNPNLIRPPGSLPENEFLARCIKCGQCMRICPTNVIQPADIFTGGFEGIWTPQLNFRIGSSGCQLNCIACGNLCPTGAIFPVRLNQRLGIKEYAEQGAIRIGTAFVDQGRCLPWSMQKPCIVCQENCPVSPKAIMIEQIFTTLVNSFIRSVDEDNNLIYLDTSNLAEGKYSTGDYFLRDVQSSARYLISATKNNSLTIEYKKQYNQEDYNKEKELSPKKQNKEYQEQSDKGQHKEYLKESYSLVKQNNFNNKFKNLKSGSPVAIEVRLQRPFIDPSRCIGCGVCEHECPVKGKRAIRVTAENESRNKNHILIG